MIRRDLLAFWVVASSALLSSGASAQLFVSAHDGKQVRAGDPVPGPFPDEIVTLSVDRAGRPKILGRVEAPATLNGPPVSIAIARGGRFALVASSQRFGPDRKLQPYGVVSMIDLTVPARPRVAGSLDLPRGAMGVALSRNNALALVACAADDAVAVVSVGRGGNLKLLMTIQLEPKSEPRDVVMSPDGRSAYVMRFGDGKITRLGIAGTKVRRVADIAVGTNPDGAIVTADGRFLYNTNFGGTPLSGATGAISTVDLRLGRMVAAVAVGQTPEHVALSPDGRFLVSVVGNGSAFTRVDPNFANVVGRLKLFRAGNAELVQVAEANIGHNCQGASFSDDGRTILVQCAVEKSISSFRFDGAKLTPVDNGLLTFDARPGAIATMRSR